MTDDEPDWLMVLRVLDDPVLPGHWVGWEVPLDFDRAATQDRFDRLVERLSVAYGFSLGGRRSARFSSCFDVVDIPVEATRTRITHERIPVALSVLVSNFGNLATYGPRYDEDAPWPDPEVWRAIHSYDRRLIEQTLSALDYRIVPKNVLDLPYEGSNDCESEMTWFDRFFRAA